METNYNQSYYKNCKDSKSITKKNEQEKEQSNKMIIQSLLELKMETIDWKQRNKKFETLLYDMKDGKIN